MVSVQGALLLTFVMGGVIFFCRVFPFLFFRKRPGIGTENGDSTPAEAPRGTRVQRSLRENFLALVEKTAPPAAMTVLALNAVSAPIKEDVSLALPVLAASALTAVLHLWRRNPLISILGGTALYMILGAIG
jgi:branched-subunit amino acid transport protein AzlD